MDSCRKFTFGNLGHFYICHVTAALQRLWSHPTCWRYINKSIIIIIIIIMLFAGVSNGFTLHLHVNSCNNYLRRRRRLCVYSSLFFRLSVCLSVGWLKKLWTDFDEISWSNRDHVIKFCRWSGSLSGSMRSPKSGFTGLLKKYLVDSDQSCVANLHCKNHSAILLRWHSAEVCALWVLLVKYFLWSYPLLLILFFC